MSLSFLPPRRRAGLLALALAVAVGAALLVAILRVQILHTRYRLAQVAALEDELRDERDRVLLEARRLRDPGRLSRLARELGFATPRRVIDLDPVATGSQETNR